MPIHRFSRLSIAVLLFAACDETTAPGGGGPVSLQIAAADSVIALGGALNLDATARNEANEPIFGIEIGWSSADSSVATIDGAGSVTPHAIGYVDLVAQAGGVADTLRLRVLDPDLPIATVRIRYGRGATAATRDVPAFMKFYDTMADGPGDEAGLVASALTTRDTVLTLLIPDDVHEGRRAITAWPLDGSAAQGVVALLRFGSAGSGDLEYFASVGAGWIDFDVDDAPAPGWRTGAVRGFVHAPLVRIAPVSGGPPVLTDDTLWLHANVNVAYQHVLRGHAVVSLLDGPVTGTSVLSEAAADEDDHGGYIAGWDADLDGLGSGPGRWELNQELRVAGPAVGTSAFPRFTGDAFGDPALWPERFSSVFYRDDARVALVADGALTITRWVPPTLEDYGELAGSIDARFELWTPDLAEPTGDTIHALTEFAVPIPPHAGLPAAPPARPKP